MTEKLTYEEAKMAGEIAGGIYYDKGSYEYERYCDKFTLFVKTNDSMSDQEKEDALYTFNKYR